MKYFFSTVLCVLLFCASSLAHSDETISIFNLPGAKDPRLSMFYSGALYSYDDPSGALTTWLLAFELTRKARFENSLNPDSSSRRQSHKVDLTSPLGRHFQAYLQKRPWAKKIVAEGFSPPVTYATFFDLVGPKLRSDFAAMSVRPVKIVRIDPQGHYFMSRLDTGDHPIAALNRSLEFLWIPKISTRSTLSVTLDKP
ncbi:MAG: hypothetical protein HC902_11560 [Calothrix sp. SM1_5_4]|nr:hypothetical protein [Calothrix sp. SM1_5_4]